MALNLESCSRGIKTLLGTRLRCSKAQGGFKGCLMGCEGKMPSLIPQAWYDTGKARNMARAARSATRGPLN